MEKNVTLKNCIPEISPLMRVGKVDKRVLGPVLMGFFIMGFCDMVAPITGRIALEFPASRQAAVSFLPTMVFLWFLVLSTPLAALMNRIGRKATALIGYAFTVVGLMVPYVAGEGCALGWYFAGFGLLGVGNTAIQVAINPLLATIVPGERMTSYLTVGQIFRNTSLLLLAPIVTALVALTGSWRLLLPIYAGLTVLGGIWLQATSVAEPPRSDRAAGMADCFRLLGNPTVLLCTLGVACFIAGDVGIGFLSVRLIDNPPPLCKKGQRLRQIDQLRCLDSLSLKIVVVHRIPVRNQRLFQFVPILQSQVGFFSVKQITPCKAAVFDILQ